MATLNEMFPSKFLKATDLGGREVPATISHVTQETFEQDGRKQVKAVVHFRDNGLKPLVTNKTNFQLIAAATGQPDSDHWPGHQVVLYMDMVPFQGRIMESIRVRRAPAPAIAPATPPALTVVPPAPVAAQPQPASAAEALNDSVPF